MYRKILNQPIFRFPMKTSWKFSSSLPEESSNSSSYSSLYVSAKYSQQMSNILKPSYTVDYFKYLSNNLDQIQNLMTARGLEPEFSKEEFKCDLNNFIVSLEETTSLRKKRDRLMKKLHKNNLPQSPKYIEIKNKHDIARERFFELEDKVMPIVLGIPNDIHVGIGDIPEIVDDFAGSSNDKLKQSKAISYVRLGYINNMYQSSIVGSNAKYLIGDGAQLYYALVEYLNDLFDSKTFVPISGNDLVKSVLIEAVNSKKPVTDSCMIKLNPNQSQDNQRLHLVGDASLESLCSLLVNNNVTEQMFYQVGSSYDDSSRSVEQHYSFRASIVSENTESDDKFDQLYRIWWNFLTESLEMKCRSVRIGLSSLQPNEYCKFVILVWLHSAGEWIEVASITHYKHYISQRLGIDNYHNTHLISSSVDLFQLFKCLIEHYQDATTGKINRPKCLVKYF